MTTQLRPGKVAFVARTQPMDKRPVFFDVAQCLRQDGSEDFTADDAARLEALGYTIVWPFAPEANKARPERPT